MKKILLSSLIGLSLLGSKDLFAQTSKGKLDKQLTVERDNSRAAKPSFAMHNDKKTRANSRWYDMLDATLNYRNGDTTGLDANTNSTFLWIDSTMRVMYTGIGYGGIYLKSCGQILDPFAKRFNDHTKLPANYLGEMAIKPTDGFTIDSVGVAGFYRRIAAKASIVDTLIISVTYGGFAAGANITSGYWTGAANTDLLTCYGVDTMTSAFIDYKWSTADILPGATGATVITKKLLLNAADSGSKYFFTNIGLPVPASNVAAMTYTFKSGDTWIPNVDTVADFNFFRPYYTEEVLNEVALYEKKDYNSNQSLENDTTGWGITYVPNYLYIGATGCSKTFPREQYWTLWKLTSNATAVVGTFDEFNKGIETTVTPNPASGNVNFSINLNSAAKNVTVSLANILGQEVKNINVGAISANNTQSVNMNISDLASGLYIYTINADGRKLSNKLQVR